jgi:HD-like signal output (HDOD) protein
VSDTFGTESKRDSLTPEQIIERLNRAIRHDGDFPASAKVVNEINALTKLPTTTAIRLSEIILREPSLGVRVLNFVNSAFYMRERPIATISQAVIQIGMVQLADLCASLVVVQKFVPAARRGGPLGTCLRRAIVTSLILDKLGSAAINTEVKGTRNEAGHLLGWFSELGSLLLAFYFPEIYEGAQKRAEVKKIDLDQALIQVTGLSRSRLSAEILKELGLPSFYSDVLAIHDALERKQTSPSKDPYLNTAALALKYASSLSLAITVASPDSPRGRPMVQSLTEAACKELNIPHDVFGVIFNTLNHGYKEFCLTVGVSLPELPDYLEQPIEPGPEEFVFGESDHDGVDPEYIVEIRQAIDSREPVSTVISTAMESVAWGIGFDRVLLLLLVPTKKELICRMSIGSFGDLNPNTIGRPLVAPGDEEFPDSTAFFESRPVFEGQPIFEDGAPFAVIPVGFDKNVLGVMYVDRVNSPVKELTVKEKQALTQIAELLEQAISSQ